MVPHHVHWVMMALSASVHALDNGVAITPPMGWNSYMSGIGGELTSCIPKLNVCQQLKAAVHTVTQPEHMAACILACRTLASLDH